MAAVAEFDGVRIDPNMVYSIPVEVTPELIAAQDLKTGESIKEAYRLVAGEDMPAFMAGSLFDDGSRVVIVQGPNMADRAREILESVRNGGSSVLNNPVVGQVGHTVGDAAGTVASTIRNGENTPVARAVNATGKVAVGVLADALTILVAVKLADGTIKLVRAHVMPRISRFIPQPIKDAGEKVEDAVLTGTGKVIGGAMLAGDTVVDGVKTVLGTPQRVLGHVTGRTKIVKSIEALEEKSQKTDKTIDDLAASVATLRGLMEKHLLDAEQSRAVLDELNDSVKDALARLDRGEKQDKALLESIEDLRAKRSSRQSTRRAREEVERTEPTEEERELVGKKMEEELQKSDEERREGQKGA